MDKILIIQTAFLGDVLLSIPTLLRLRTLYPKSEITLLCRKGLGEIFRELNLADVVIELNKKNKAEFSKTLFELKQKKYDLLLCPHQSYRSAFMSYQIKATQKIGFRELWNFFIFNRSVTRSTGLPDALRQFSLLSPLDASSKRTVETFLAHRHKIPHIAKMGLREKIKKHPRYDEIIEKFKFKENAFLVAPGSVWNTKRWTKEGFQKLSQILARQDQVVFIGSPEERELCGEIAKDIPGAINIAGETSLFELLVLMTTARLIICNDSGAMHMASVAELPAVTIFGPTVLSLGYEPWQENAIVVENKDLSCRPCGKHGHDKCPIGTHICMKSISHQAVLKAVQKIPFIRQSPSR